MNLSSGGLAILAIAAIWFLVFLPSLVNGDQAKKQQLERIQKAEEIAKTRLGERAQAALRMRRTRTIMFALALAAVLVAGLASLELASSGAGLQVVIGAGVTAGIFAVLTIRSNRKYRELLAGSVRRAVPIVAPVIKRANLTPTPETKEWQPESLPKQSYLQTGAIEIVDFAEVTELVSQNVEPETVSIDEILRRRRNVG